MQQIQNLLDSMKMDLTSNVCKSEVHPKRDIQMMLVDGKEVCPICETHRMNLELEKQETEKYFAFQQSKKHRTLQSKSVIRDVALQKASFTNYETDEKEAAENKQKAVQAFLLYKEGKIFNTWLTGSPGVGKSHLAMSILRNLNEIGEKSYECLFVSVDEMLLKIRESFDNKESRYTESYFVNLLSEVDYLVLDDLGAETGGTGTTKKATDFTLRVLYAIANARQNKSTIITSNLSRKQLEAMYDNKLVSRLLKDTHLIKFEKTTDKRIRSVDF